MVTAYLNGHIRKGRSVIHVTPPFQNLDFTFVANEGRSEADGAKFKVMGVRPGVTDFLFWWPNKGFGAVELKTPIGTLSPHQRDFRSKMETYGHNWALCRSVAQVRDTLVGWGLKCHNMNCIEPAPTFEEKVDFMKQFNQRL